MREICEYCGSDEKGHSLSHCREYLRAALNHANLESGFLRGVLAAAREYLDDDYIVQCAHSKIACGLCADKIANLRIAIRIAEQFR